MKKTTKLAKRVLSVVLALSIVLSFAISVSAVPSDYTVVDGKSKLLTFEDDAKVGTANNICGTYEISTEKAYEGAKSFKITPRSSDNLFKFWYKPTGFTFEANSTYLMTFNYSFEFADENITDAHSGSIMHATIWDNSTGKAGEFTKSVWNVDTDKADWKKTIIRLTTGDTAPTYLSIGSYLKANEVVYIDNWEISKVDGFTSNVSQTLPKGGSTTLSSVRDFEDGILTLQSGYANFGAITSGQVTASLAGIANNGSMSLKVKGAETNTESAGVYMQGYRTFGETIATKENINLVKSGLYYMSYYAYTEAEGISTNVGLSNGYTIVPSTSLEAGKWTKVSGIYDFTEEFAAKVNSALFRLNFGNLANNTVFVDDIYFAKVDFVEPAMLYDVNAEFNSADNTAVVKATSTVALKSATVSAPAGVTASDVVISKDGTEVSFNVSGLTSNTTYELTVNVSDVFGSAASSVPVVFTTPMTISASSIADGATDVLAPVDCIFIDTPTAVIESTVTADKFTLEGAEYAEITDVSVADGRIKVELDGIYGAETYTLKVNGVEAVNGAVLQDAITFTTKASEKGYNLSFEKVAENDDGTLVVPGQLAKVGAMAIAVDEEVVYEGKRSISIAMQDLGYDKIAKIAMNHLNVNKTYKVSFNISSGWTLAGQRAGQAVLSGDGISIVGKPVFAATEKEGWNKYSAIIQTGNIGGTVLNLWGVTTDKVYLDNVKVQEIGTISNPVMFNDGAIVNTIAAGTTNITLATATDMTASKAYAVQYNADGKMIQVVPATIEADAITFAVTSTDAVKTKLIIMDGTSYAPAINYIQFN